MFEQYICGLDISVDDIVLVKLFVTLDDMLHKQQGLSLAQPGAFFRVQISFEVSVFAVLQEQVQVISALEVVVEFNDVRRVEFGEVFYFVLNLFR